MGPDRGGAGGPYRAGSWERLACELAAAVPGTTPDYWMAADDKLTATMLDVLDKRSQAQADKAKGKGKTRPRR